MTQKLERCNGKVLLNYAYGVANAVRDTHIRKKARLNPVWRGQPEKTGEGGNHTRGIGGAKENWQVGNGALRCLRVGLSLRV